LRKSSALIARRFQPQPLVRESWHCLIHKLAGHIRALQGNFRFHRLEDKLITELVWGIVDLWVGKPVLSYFAGWGLASAGVDGVDSDVDIALSAKLATAWGAGADCAAGHPWPFGVVGKIVAPARNAAGDSQQMSCGPNGGQTPSLPGPPWWLKNLF